MDTKIKNYLSRIKNQHSDDFSLNKFTGSEAPLRAELFSSDQMEQHGKFLAGSHRLGIHRASDPQLLARLTENETFLIEVHNLLTDAVKAKHLITPAGEWLLDNFYLIEEQIRTGKMHLPKSYSRELPRLSDGPSKGLPRVYDLALETISHGDGRVDPETLSRFISAYQTVTTLKLGELWAIPTMLRLALIENLRRVAARVATGRTERNLANFWADQMIETASMDPKSLILIIADMVRTDPPITTAFVSEFARRLQSLNNTLISPLAWIEQRLAESGLTIEKVVQLGSQQQAADQVSISNSIGSLRFLDAMDWHQFVEMMSTVDHILQTDPSGIYAKMDFTTRDHYRHVIENIAKRSLLPEEAIAQAAVNLAKEGALRNGSQDRTAHVGFYLISRGLKQLEQLSEVRFSPLTSLKKISRQVPLLVYIGPIMLITILLTYGLLTKAYEGGFRGLMLALMGIIIFLSASHLAVALVNWISTFLVTPEPLPKMDLSEGIPPELRTLVVIPTMLMNGQNIKELAESLEVRFLANRVDNLHFGLLTDLKDADQETLPEDEDLVKLASKKIQELNEKYKGSDGDTFFLFHRPRLWNPRERLWMGYERKRGKLEDLNALLRGGSQKNFSVIVGNTEVLQYVKYVITLDTDTQLPRDSASEMIGAMAHPLNQAYYKAEKGRVLEGYAILQPRVAVSLPGTNRSRYARLYGSQPGIDPYTRAVSDVYQDLFGEGSFIGKGIYDVDVFMNVLNGRFPENQILSHDLIEGCYTRAGLLSDVQLYEEYPSNYYADVSRRHRWIRGDWQLVRWLLPLVPGLKGGTQKNPLSALSRWKLLDNLRRSLIPLALTLLFILGWTLLPQAWYWTLQGVGIILIPSIVISILDFLRKPADMPMSQHLAASARSSGTHLAQAAFSLITLPFEAFFSQDAIIRTLWRMLISRRKLLEWNPSHFTGGNGHGLSLLSSYGRMWISPAVAAFTLLYFWLSKQTVPAVIFPVLFLWAAAPAAAWWIGLPVERRKARLSEEQHLFLRNLARRTWSFFETFVGPEDNWLPPDNYQESPVDVTAHRTSPTNIGLSLLANLTAYDFGYIAAGQLLERTSNTFATMEIMERYQGHFLNWYDTKSLVPLRPKYISSVDSGNLAGHLLTLRQGLLALPDKKIVEVQLFEGISDTLRILAEAAESIGRDRLSQLQRDLKLTLSAPPSNLSEAWQALDKLADAASIVEEDFNSGPENEASWWAHALARQCRGALEDLVFLAPWLGSAAVSYNGENLQLPGADKIPTLNELAALDLELMPVIEQRFSGSGTITEEKKRPDKLRQLITESCSRANERIKTIKNLASQSDEFSNIEYEFLYNRTRHLLSIGYNVEDKRRDSSYYDLLASEARLSSFVAIAQGQLPQESWFALGRLLTSISGEQILLSWSGSMFEYLMPLLVMPTYENTLLDQTCKTAVKRQIEYGKQRGVPWGISESGYNTVDVNLNYQYRAFGVPGLGLKRGLASDLVIAPYASVLALMVEPEEACLNLQKLDSEGFSGRYGFYEAIDYTPSRLPRERESVVIKSFMAHHEGMSLLSLAYLILDRPMQKRFESDPIFEATILLLQERIPRTPLFYSHASGLSDTPTGSGNMDMPVRIISGHNRATPEVQLLSNGRYNVMITDAGGGYSRWKDIALTRWHEDSTCDNWGSFCYIRDTASGEFWSATFQPALKRSKNYEAIFTEGHAEFRRSDENLDMHTEVIVSPEDDIELRRIHLTNRSRTHRTIEITSYAEVVLATSASDALHPAFSNLFVQTEIIRERQAILCTRRPRSPEDQTLWMFHMMTVRGANVGEVSFETDRMQFIGRGNTIANPRAMKDAIKLSDSQGSVLDPIVAIRYHIMIEPETTATIDMILGIGESRQAAMSLIDKYQDRRLTNRVFELGWTHSQVILRQINATEADAQLYGRLANSVIYANAFLRADAGVIKNNRRGQSGLWGYSISGDLPIVLLQIEDPSNINLVQQMVQAHAYWRLKGLAVDLVIWNEDHAGYRQQLQEQIMRLIAAGIEANNVDRPGGIFVRQADQISNEDRTLIQTVARIIISDRRGTLEAQIKQRQPVLEPPVWRLRPPKSYHPHSQQDEPEISRSDLLFFNGFGGFTQDGREYVITTTGRNRTPAPWINVLANPDFGTVVSESGPTYTWSENAHEFRLTPWNNDPVSDSSGEAFYMRDEETGHFWSPTPLPSRGTGPYVSRHGFGYSVFEHTEEGIRTELWIYVALDAAVKFSVLKVRNLSPRLRRLSATGYVELLLGDLRPKSVMHVVTEVDSARRAVFARNSYNPDFPGRVTFFQTDHLIHTITCDRTEFIGRNGTLQNPAAMSRSHLSGKSGAALDPCAAIQVPFELYEGQEREFVFRLGVGKDSNDAGNLLKRFEGPAAARSELESVWQYWKRTLGAVQVQTPDPSLNVLTNGWLLYQTLACRIWARSGYYQSGGAFGFRDQLQDTMAIIHTEPLLMRNHLLLSAGHQFLEGDAQHWWHPPTGRGVRTHCSDDYLWLPLAACRYVLATGDTGVLDEQINFLEGREVNPDEDSYYDLPIRSSETGSLYQHCVQAILRGLRFGEHGLPLIGTCDWNDGMNTVGIHGKGESVWLGFFLYEVLLQFAKVAGIRNDNSFAERCRVEAYNLRRNIEQNAWDGEWYRRAYFDDGSPLGSANNTECRIDSIAQSWSVLSGAGDVKRSHTAMNSLNKYLVRRNHKLIQLLDPPFDKSDLNPGYIKGYVPGVRENGGQYTHAAVWAAMAFAALGDSQHAWELLEIINPVNHGKSPDAISVYKVEPYVVAADVYALSPHTGRGGWTWYTGSAGWMYRLIVESLLGLRLEVDRLYIEPCLPAAWENFRVTYRYRETVYNITILQIHSNDGVSGLSVDGVWNNVKVISLVDDRIDHAVEVRIIGPVQKSV